MEFSWLIFVSVVIANFLCIGVMLLAQALDKSLPTRNSIIPGTNQKFLYIQDFWTMVYGDMFGVSLITTAFVHLAVNEYVNLWQWITLVTITVVSAIGFMKMCLGKDHKPDYGFPEIGKISTAGVLHLPYFGVGIAVSAVTTWNLVAANLWKEPTMWVGLAGGAWYITCFILEIKSGNFDPLKRVLLQKV